MAAFTAAALRRTFSSNAEFQQITSQIQTCLGNGFVYVPQTGDSDFTTVTKPGTTNTVAGWRVYRSDDAAGSLNNFYVKVEVGTGANIAGFQLWITVGWGVDGSGNLTGHVGTRYASDGGSVAGTFDSYFSSSTEHVSVGLWGGTGGSGVNFGIERTRDATGAKQDEIFLVFATNVGLSLYSHQPVPRAGTVPNATALAYTALGSGFIFVGSAQATYNGQKGIGLLHPIKGGLLMPSTNMFPANSSDFSNIGQTLPVVMYGVTRTYIATAPISNSQRIFVRYD